MLSNLTLLDASGPDGNRVDYLASILLPVWLRNETEDGLVVERISLVFQGPHGVPEAALTVTGSCHVDIPPKGNGYYNIEVRPSLVWLPHTNRCHVQVTYRWQTGSQAGRVVKEAVGDRHLVIRPAPTTGETVFISFKDAADLQLAEMAATYLERAGIKHYLFREDAFPGSDYWRDKLEPAIEGALATLVIWTPNTCQGPAAVLRELCFSQMAGTPVGLFLEKNTTPPAEYAASKVEYYEFRRDCAEEDISKGIEACAARWRRGGPFFGSPVLVASS